MVKLPVKTGYKRISGVRKTLKSVRSEAGQKVRIALYSDPKVEMEMISMLRYRDGASAEDRQEVLFSVNMIADDQKREESIKRSDLAIVVITPKMTNERIARAALYSENARRRLVVVAEKERDDLQAARLSSVFDVKTDDIVFIPHLNVGSVQSELIPKILTALRNKEIALAAAVESFKDEVLRRTIASTANQNAAIGVFVFIPGADMPLLTMNQIKMVLRLSAIYRQELSLKRLYEILGVVAGGILFRELARQLIAFIPVLGWLLKGAIAYGGTLAMGRLTVAYLEGKSSGKAELTGGKS